MIIIIEFIGLSALYLIPWGICEFAHQRNRRKLAGEIKTQQAIIQQQKEQVETLKARESRQQLVIGAQREKLQNMLAKLRTDDKALPPASAKAVVTGAAVNLHPLAIRVTTGLPPIGSPAFSRRRQ